MAFLQHAADHHKINNHGQISFPHETLPLVKQYYNSGAYPTSRRPESSGTQSL